MTTVSYSNIGQAGSYANSAYPSSTNGSNNMYSQHGHHLLGSSANQHHHANAYGSSTANTGSNHHTSSTDTGLAPQSSFDTVPGSQHTGSLHQSPSSASGGWGQSMHYSTSANGANPYGSQAHSMYGSGGYYGSAGTQTPSGAVTGSNGAGSGAYSAYGMQPHQTQTAAQPHSAYGSSGALANGLNGSTGGGSAHHSGSSTPTSQTPYHHQHPHSVGSVFPSPQGYPTHHQQGGYYGAHGNASSNSVVSSSPSYTSAPQYSTQLPLAGRHRVTTTLWEDEGTLCFQVDARGVCVARRHDNSMINGTKLLNVCGMSRGKRDGILKNEKERIVVKVGAMHLKGVWITFQRGKQLAEQNNILDVLYPLFEQNIQSFLYHPDNYPRTAAVMAAAQERHAQRSRASLGTDSPTGYQRASSQTANGTTTNGQVNPPPLMRANTTPNNGPLAPGAYGHTNGYSSAPGHSPSGHLNAHLGTGGSNGGAIPQRPSPVDRRVVTPFDVNESFEGGYAGLMKPRTHSGYKRELQGSYIGNEQGFAYDERA